MSQENHTNTVDAVETEVDAGSTTATDAETMASAGGETSLGLDENVASALSYAFGFVSGILLFLLEKENRTVRFHAAQSMVLFAGIVALSFALTFLGIVIDIVMPNLAGFLVGLVVSLGTLGLSLVAFLLWVYLVVRAFQGANPRIPVVAGVADGLAN